MNTGSNWNWKLMSQNLNLQSVILHTKFCTYLYKAALLKEEQTAKLLIGFTVYYSFFTNPVILLSFYCNFFARCPTGILLV